MKYLSLAKIIWLMTYLVLMGGSVWGLSQARDWARQELGTTEALADWEVWRAETKRQRDGDGPVTRRVAKSPQPPTLVLLSDHYTICLSALLLLGSVLFFSFTWLLRGALTATPYRIHQDE